MTHQKTDMSSKPAEKGRVDAVSGEDIKRQRESQKISLDTIREKTKIGKFTLTLIEDNVYSSLPAPVYLKSFLRQIATIIGLDPDQTASGYIKTMLEASDKKNKKPQGINSD